MKTLKEYIADNRNSVIEDIQYEVNQYCDITVKMVANHLISDECNEKYNEFPKASWSEKERYEKALNLAVSKAISSTIWQTRHEMDEIRRQSKINQMRG